MGYVRTETSQLLPFTLQIPSPQRCKTLTIRCQLLRRQTTQVLPDTQRVLRIERRGNNISSLDNRVSVGCSVPLVDLYPDRLERPVDFDRRCR